MRVSNNKGFSLIEVLVTVGLIGILVGIAIPSYQGYKKNTVKMALKADLGNGAKVYNAKYAVESTYCYNLIDVGLPAQDGRKGNPIYKKKGFFGFGNIGGNCSNVTDVKKYQFKANGASCTDGASSTKMACNTAMGMWHTRPDLVSTVGGAACTLNDNDFLLGAYTDVAALDTFLTADHEGRIGEASGASNCTKP